MRVGGSPVVLCEALECPRLQHPYPGMPLVAEKLAKVGRNGARVPPTRAGRRV